MPTINITPFYVLSYIIYTLFTSTILSLILVVRCLHRLIANPSNGSKAGSVVVLYQGIAYHARRHPVCNSFKFHARYELTDLDLPPYSPKGFLTADEARKATKTNGHISAEDSAKYGIRKKPGKFDYCYDIQDSSQTLKRCIVEASNTPWGESVTFVFNPSSDLVPKSEYISPFMDMEGSWRLKVSEPGKHLYALISVHHPLHGNYFFASFTAARVSMSEHCLHDAFFWLLPQRVSLTTYWNAMKLWWKNVTWYDHPRRQNLMSYRAHAVARDKHAEFDRCFVWKDAAWPWSSC